MPIFQDSNGREWSIKFDGLLLSDLQQQHGINLADVTGTGFAAIDRDASALSVAAAFLVRDQLKSAGITREQFAAAFVGECQEQAFDAIWGAAKVFFPPKRWSALQSNFNQLRSQWEEMGPALAMVGMMPDSLRPAVMEALTAGMSTALVSSTGKPSATGPDASPSSAASPSPDSAASTPAA